MESKRVVGGQDKENANPQPSCLDPRIVGPSRRPVLRQRTPPPQAKQHQRGGEGEQERSPLTDITPPREKESKGQDAESFSFPKLTGSSFSTSRGIVKASQLR
ncbi:hypothetical protein HOP50_11g62500 [Chloropicon primus]|uniref:Uncharacterized protein n=1 Tax=Chloropicon primus TaxID=1764295 RepID=A0A5B8MW67_9CHLO|nr:hypothetical protein A3770_11p62280 [Chloropicon primus]UPR02923.1 hypothetical protein HOP50_11g62500 [Chloropicon primus]|eukprot:QDZ23710.1 hypothetical protein A3770_11p62280 [Chloropicon primus]